MFPSTWLGSEASFLSHIYTRLFYHDSRASYLQQETQLRFSDEDDEGFGLSEHLASRMIQKQGSVGIITIDGALTSDESFYNLWFGDVAYPTIATAINMLLSDQEIRSIVTAWSSPGGDASGIADLGTFMKDAGKVKPIHAWTGQAALSAAYWAAACCKTVRASDLGETGSVGAIMQFTSIARRLQEDGVDVHLERSGKYKALLQPTEALSEAGKELMQEKVTKLHSFFIDHIEAARPKLKNTPRPQWAEGKTYFAEEAIQIGLVDGPPISLSGLVAQLQRANDKSAQAQPRGMNMAKQVLLNPQAAAQLASGVPIEELKDKPTEVELTDGEPGEDTTQIPDSEGDEGSELNVSDAPSTPTTPAVAEVGLTAYLKEKVTDLETQLHQARSALTKSEDQLTTLKGVEDVLAPIVVEATQRLQVALGQAPATLKGFPSRTLAETYSATKQEFEKRFKTGRVSEGAADGDRQGRSLAELRLISKVGEK